MNSVMKDAKKLLIVAHMPSPNTKALAQALMRGGEAAEVDSTSQIDIEIIEPLKAAAEDIKRADGLIIFTTENFGYMSGALKDLFDRSYYDLIDIKRGLPYALLIRAGKDGTGTKRAVESICQGLGWSKVQDATIFHGEFDEAFIEQAEELAQGFALGLSEGIF